MKKSYIILGGIVCILLFSSLVFYFLSVKQTKTQKNPSFAPTPTAYPQGSATSINTKLPLTITATNPADGTTNFPVDQPLVVTFSRPFLPSEISYSLSPSIPLTTTLRQNTLILSPKTPLSQNKTYFYTITILTTQISTTYAFATAGPNPNYQINTGVNAAAQEDNFNRQNYPDFYLADQTPYSSQTFSITATPYTDSQGNRRYTFSVTLTGTNKQQDKQDFLNWLKSLQLTSEQIASFTIYYN